MVAGLIAARRKGLYKKMTTLMIGLGGKNLHKFVFLFRKKMSDV